MDSGPDGPAAATAAVAPSGSVAGFDFLQNGFRADATLLATLDQAAFITAAQETLENLEKDKIPVFK